MFGNWAKQASVGLGKCWRYLCPRPAVRQGQVAKGFYASGQEGKLKLDFGKVTVDKEGGATVAAAQSLLIGKGDLKEPGSLA
ncbi:unnamed protein product [Prunus armeniaca]|uniref:Uncharacterized protein n=1 Tax=Prunus armeniaca TaxID=36596 RepID=A0A6J5XEB6_PRUAR|nr:unnamed protein product [Prunus armeniaca]